MATRTQKVAGGLSAAVLAACAIAAPYVVKDEGWKLIGYRDPVGIPTECAGHTGPEVKVGQVRSDAYCKKVLQDDLAAHGGAIAACLPDELPLKTRAAFTRFAFNVGAGKFCASTMSKLARAGNLPGACAQLSSWVFAGGKDCRLSASNCGGIVKRRADERALCEAGLLPG